MNIIKMFNGQDAIVPVTESFALFVMPTPPLRPMIYGDVNYAPW
jgi:hypothetical protein